MNIINMQCKIQVPKIPPQKYLFVQDKETDRLILLQIILAQ